MDILNFLPPQEEDPDDKMEAFRESLMDIAKKNPYLEMEDGELVPIIETETPPLPEKRFEDAEAEIVFEPEAHLLEEDDIDDEKAKRIEKIIRSKMRTNDLTEQQMRTLYLIRTIQWESLVSPTAGEIALMLGVSHARAKQLFNALIDKKYIEMSKHPHPSHRRILFPKNTQFPWDDTDQFPPDIFNPLER